MKNFLLTVLLAGCLSLGSSASDAKTLGFNLTEDAAIRHAKTVLVGFFTGASAAHLRELPNSMDDQGNIFTDRIKVIAYEFEIIKSLAGSPIRATIEINVRGAVPLPPAGERVVIGVNEDLGSPNGGYTMTYSQFTKVNPQEHPEELNTWVRSIRSSLRLP